MVLARHIRFLYTYPMNILIAILLFALISDDERINIQPVNVEALRTQLESAVSELNIRSTDRTRVMDILHFGDFIGVDLAGNHVNYSNPDQRGYMPADVVIFGYYAEWCQNCRRNLPAVLRLYEKYRERGLKVVLTFMYSDEQRVRDYVRENQIPFSLLIGSEDREVNPEVRLETTHYILRTLLDDYRRWGTPFYILSVRDVPDTWYVVAGEFIESEIDAFLAKHLTAQ
jgi:thiol-disulfide isomerase/thioredoxin